MSGVGEARGQASEVDAGATSQPAELLRRVDAVAADLVRRGLQRGDHVAMLTPPGVDLVAGGEDLSAGEMDLEPAHPGLGAPGGTNFGGVVGKRGEIKAGEGCFEGELRAGQLHSVTRVPGEEERTKTRLGAHARRLTLDVQQVYSMKLLR